MREHKKRGGPEILAQTKKINNNHPQPFSLPPKITSKARQKQSLKSQTPPRVELQTKTPTSNEKEQKICKAKNLMGLFWFV